MSILPKRAFADEAHARAIASFFCDTLLRSGTTTPCVYCAVYPQSTYALFAEAERNMRNASRISRGSSSIAFE